MKSEAWHRRHAVQIVSALPEDAKDAVIVLELARTLVTEFLMEPEPQRSEDLERDRGVVVSLSAASSGANR